MQKGHWETAAMGLEELRCRGEPPRDYAPLLVTCLLNAHETLTEKHAERIAQLIAELERCGDAALAAGLRLQCGAKLKPRKKGLLRWW